MKNIAQLMFVAMVAMITVIYLPGCGDYETVSKNQAAVDCRDSGCPSGQRCNDKTDYYVCLPEHCYNGIRDSDEVAQDKGGSCNLAYKVDNGGPCVVKEDCNSNICSGNVCVGRAGGVPCTNGNQCQTQVCGGDGLCTGGGTLACTTNSQCSGGAKVCGGDHTCRDCVSDGECGSASLECKLGSCVARSSSTCGSGCSSGTVCVDNVCVPGQAQGFLCATPQVQILMTCWNQSTPDLQDAVHSVSPSQQVCCPSVSGSFTTSPNTTAGTYTGYQGANVSRSFQSWVNRFGTTITGGFK